MTSPSPATDITGAREVRARTRSTSRRWRPGSPRTPSPGAPASTVRRPRGAPVLRRGVQPDLPAALPRRRPDPAPSARRARRPRARTTWAASTASRPRWRRSSLRAAHRRALRRRVRHRHAEFYVMERVAGRIPRKELPRGVHLSRAQVAALCRNVIDLLVDLHAVDLQRSRARRPGQGRRLRRDGRSRAGRSATAGPGPGTSAASRRSWRGWQTTSPPTARTRLVHNDFRFDNVVLDPTIRPARSALLDWEMATVGDPLMDLGERPRLLDPGRRRRPDAARSGASRRTCPG